MADNSENPPTTPENPPTTPENPPTTPDAPPKEEATSPVLTPVPEEERPKTRGRPKGSKDGKPRIRRVPVVIEQEEEEPAAPKAAPKRVQVKEPEPEPEAEAEPEPPPKKKSPRTLHQEHAQAIATERRKLAQAKQAHYEGLFDRNLSW